MPIATCDASNYARCQQPRDVSNHTRCQQLRAVPIATCDASNHMRCQQPHAMPATTRCANCWTVEGTEVMMCACVLYCLYSRAGMCLAFIDFRIIVYYHISRIS